MGRGPAAGGAALPARGGPGDRGADVAPGGRLSPLGRAKGAAAGRTDRARRGQRGRGPRGGSGRGRAGGAKPRGSAGRPSRGGGDPRDAAQTERPGGRGRGRDRHGAGDQRGPRRRAGGHGSARFSSSRFGGRSRFRTRRSPRWGSRGDASERAWRSRRPPARASSACLRPAMPPISRTWFAAGSAARRRPSSAQAQTSGGTERGASPLRLVRTARAPRAPGRASTRRPRARAGTR